MNENQKVLIKNLTNHEVGFLCPNSRKNFVLAPDQLLSVKWEYIEDVEYDKGFRYFFENGYLKIDSKTENYEEVMDELQLSYLKEKIDKSLSYEDVKKILKKNPLSTQYAVIKKHLREGTETTKQNFANAALELKIKDYTINTAIKNATGIDVLKALELNEEPQKQIGE